MDESGSADATALREYLAANDARCPRCRYDLRGLTDERCPECGRALTLSEVSDPDNVRRPLAWRACYAPLAILAGIGAILGFALLPIAILFWIDGDQLGPVCAVLSVFSFGPVLIERRWRRHARTTARWPDQRLWRIAALFWLLLFLALATPWILGWILGLLYFQKHAPR